MQILLIILLAAITLLSLSLQRTYANLPLKEVKHRARKGDDLAAALLKAVGYGHSLRVVLWIFVGLSAAGFFVVVALNTPVWLAFLASIMLTWVGFVWLPAARVSRFSEKLAGLFAPLLGKLLAYIHPVIDWAAQFISRHRPVNIHTGLYDRQDMIDLLQRQQVQGDSRIEKSELSIALNALKFGDDTVAQHMTPRRVVRSVSADEPLGPVLMDELHASGYSRFPVYSDKPDNLVGTLFLRDLVHTTRSGTIQKLMKPKVAYIHEDQSLNDALQAILKTHKQLFVVVNSFEEYVGIITIEDILETVIGLPIIDEFDEYEDLRAVAARAAKQDHKQHLSEQIEPEKPTEQSTEVIE